MARVAIVTDSSNCLPRELLREYGIGVVPISLVVQRKTYRDQVDITPAEFYRLYPALKEGPTTSAPSPGDFLGAITGLADSTDSILCIVVSRVLSSVYRSAEEGCRLAREGKPGIKVELLDSRTAGGAMGFLVLEAARAARAGRTLDEVAQAVRELIPRVKFLAVLDTLKYLIRGGRAPRVAVLGELLQIKPILGLVGDSGMPEPLARAATKRQALLKMVGMVPRYADITRPLHVMVHYSEDRSEGEELLKILTCRYRVAESYLTELTPVMACHSGPMVGMSFYT